MFILHQHPKKIYQTIISNAYARYPERLPENHWYGEWYQDDVMDILLQEIEKRSGFIYVAASSSVYHKVGMTRKQPEERIRSLNSAGVLHDLQLIMAYPVYDVQIEKYIHQTLKQLTPYHHKEHFALPVNVISKVIDEEHQKFLSFLKNIGLPLF